MTARILDTRKLNVMGPGSDCAPDEMRIEVVGEKPALTLTDEALRQIADHTGVPWRQVVRLRLDAPRLLAALMNFWLHKHPTTRLLETDGESVTGFRSPRFAPLFAAEI